METKYAVILVIDDQPANLKVLLPFLKQHNFEVRIAENGDRALQVLDNYQPDIILLDVMMPGIDGFETCRRIKANKETADIPVIFMTALDSVEDKVSGFEAGGVDYITKPFQQAEVLARVNTHITLRKQKLELEQALAEVKKLSGFLPICAFCKKIRDDEGYWQQVEQYITEHSEAIFSHGVCPTCAEEHYGDILRKMKNEKKG
ncbi:MAG: response regulator [Thermodesulfobacteriota bacterium]|nr:response regulator [Thermodesulfobacteriota bacterium]